MLRSLSLRAATVVAAAGLIAAPAAGPAFAADDSYPVQLRQQLPRTATDGGGSQEGGEKCPGIPAGKDGWHFVLPGNDAHFVKLTVTFEPGGEQVVTTFGPPTDKHAYVASAPGAKLTSAVARVSGGELDLFNLSHTCPAVVPSGTPSMTPSTTPSTTPSGSPSASVTPSTSASPSASVTPSKSGSASPSASVTPSQSTSPSAGVSPSAGSSSPAAGAPSASPSVAAGSGSGSLASTGASVGGAALAGALLIGVGGVLVMRRRKAAAGQE